MLPFRSSDVAFWLNPFLIRSISLLPFPPGGCQLKAALTCEWVILTLTCSLKVTTNTLTYSYVSAMFEEEAFYLKTKYLTV